MASEIAQQALKEVAQGSPGALYVIGGVILTFMGADKVAFWVQKFKSRNGKNGTKEISVKCPSGMPDKVSKLYDWHNVNDADGAKIWYVPRSWQKTQLQIANTLRDISESQHKISDTMERLEQRIDK